MKKYIYSNTAFSLIELSIVLVIIGLLVAGVTGGKSLIESAKTRALINEIRGYKQAVNTFYVAHDRFPGDANKDGEINQKDEALYNFISPYNRNISNIHIQAPWVELYLDNIIDFKVNPDELGTTNVKNNLELSAAPRSRVFSEIGYDISDSSNWAFYEDYGQIEFPILELGGNYSSIANKIYKNIDNKMDDGKELTGNVIAHEICDYEDSTDCPTIGILLNFN